MEGGQGMGISGYKWNSDVKNEMKRDSDDFVNDELDYRCVIWEAEKVRRIAPRLSLYPRSPGADEREREMRRILLRTCQDLPRIPGEQFEPATYLTGTCHGFDQDQIGLDTCSQGPVSNLCG